MWQSAYDFVFNTPSGPNPPAPPTDFGPGPGPWKDADPGNVWMPTGFDQRENQWVADDWRYGENSQYQPMMLPEGWDPYEVEGFDFSQDDAGYGWYTSQADLGSFSALMHSPKQTGRFDGKNSIGRGFAGFRRPGVDGSPAGTNEAIAAYYNQTWDKDTRTRTGGTKASDEWYVDPWEIKPGEGFDPNLQAGWDFDISNNLLSNMSGDFLKEAYNWDINPTVGTTPIVSHGAGTHDWRDLGPEAYGFGGWLAAGADAAGDFDLRTDHPDFDASETMSFWDPKDGLMHPGQKRLAFHGLVGTPEDWWDRFGGNYENLNSKVKRQWDWRQTDLRNLDFLDDDHHLKKRSHLLGLQYDAVPDKKGNRYYENEPGYDWHYLPENGTQSWGQPNLWEHNVGKDAFSVWKKTTNYGRHDYDTSTKDDWVDPDKWGQMPEQFWDGEHHGWMSPDDPRNTTDDWAYQAPDNPDINWDYQPPTEPADDFSPIWQQRSNPVSQSVFNYDPETAGYQLDLDSGSYGYTSPGSKLSQYRNYSPYRRGSSSSLKGRSGTPRKPYESERITSEMVPWLPTPYHDSDGWFYGE